MKSRLPGAVLLFTLSVALVLPELGSVVATGIENPTCELVGLGVYRIDFQASPDAGPVEVFASSRPIASILPNSPFEARPPRF